MLDWPLRENNVTKMRHFKDTTPPKKSENYSMRTTYLHMSGLGLLRVD